MKKDFVMIKKFNLLFFLDLKTEALFLHLYLFRPIKK